MYIKETHILCSVIVLYTDHSLN